MALAIMDSVTVRDAVSTYESVSLGSVAERDGMLDSVASCVKEKDAVAVLNALTDSVAMCVCDGDSGDGSVSDKDAVIVLHCASDDEHTCGVSLLSGQRRQCSVLLFAPISGFQ